MQRTSAPPKASRPSPKKTVKKHSASADKAASIFAVLIVFLAFYLIITLFIAGTIYYSFNDTEDAVDIYSVQVFFDETRLFNLPATQVNNEYGLYVPYSCIEEICMLGIAGEDDNVTFFITGTDNRIECTLNSSLIVINGNPVRISAPVLYSNSDEGGDYLLPIALVDNYINGIDVSYDDDKKICMITTDSGKTDISLKLLLPETMSPADFPDSYKEYITPSEPEDVSQ